MPYKDKDKERAHRRQYQRQWVEARRAKGVQLLGGKCADCGSTDRLEIDHIDPATKDPRLVKSTRVGYLWHWTWDAILAELAKCTVRCHECHQRKSAAEALRGEQVGGSKLTADDVRSIRASRIRPYKTLGAMYGIDASTVGYIIRGKSWKHVQ